MSVIFKYKQLNEDIKKNYFDASICDRGDSSIAY